MKHNYPAKRTYRKSGINGRLTIINSIKETGKLPDPKTFKGNLNNYVFLMRYEGIIKRIGYGVWEVIKEHTVNSEAPMVTTKHLLDKPVKSDDSRVHNLMFKLKVEAPLSWESRLQARGLPFDRLRYGVLRLVFDGFKVWLCRSSVIVYFPSGIDFRASSVPVSLRLAVKGFFSLVPRLEAYLGFSLRSASGSLVWSMNRKHIGLMKNSLAQLYAKEGKKLNFFDDRGLWLVADDSYNLNELEFVRSSTNDLEAPDMQTKFNDWKKTPVLLSELVHLHTIEAYNFAQLSLTVSKLAEVVKVLVERFGGVP